jgi:hypothetical protein
MVNRLFYKLEVRGTVVRIWSGVRDFVLRSPDRPMGPPNLLSCSERGVDHSLLSKAEVKNEYVFLE